MGAGWWGPAFLMDSGAMSSDELTSQVRVSRLREETRLAQVDAACKGQSQVFKKKKKARTGATTWISFFLILAGRTALQSSLKEEIPKAVVAKRNLTEPHKHTEEHAIHSSPLTRSYFLPSREAHLQLKEDGI